MTLQEKFEQAPEIYNKNLEVIKSYEKIADEYAIEVLKFYHNSLFMIALKDGEAKRILNHIKKEKTL